jgi:hypothetical protein
MPTPRRLLASPLLLGLALLTACEETDGKLSDSGGEGGSGADGSTDDGGSGDEGPGEDGSDDGGEVEAAALAVLTVSSAVDGAEGGTISLRVRPADSGQACRDGCGLGFDVDEEPVHVPLEASDAGDGSLLLTGTLPPGLVPSGAALAELLDGETVVGHAPLRLRNSNATAALSPLEPGAPRVTLPDPDTGWVPLTSTTQALSSPTGDVILAGLARWRPPTGASGSLYNIQDGALPSETDTADTPAALGVHLGPTSVVDDTPPAEPGAHDLVVELESAAFSAGPGDAHTGSITVRRESQGDALLAVVAHDGLMDAHLVTPDGEGGAAVEPVALALTLDSTPDLVLDIAPLELSDGTLTVGVLGLREVDVGKWQGLWFDGRKAYPFDSMGGASADELAAGTAFAGLVHTGAVREPVAPGKSTFWSFTPASVKDGCTATAGLHAIGSTVTELRTLKLQDQEVDGHCSTLSDPRAAAAVALDGDEDGSLDVVLQVWGADKNGLPTHSDHFFSDATNPRGTASGVRLEPTLPAPGHEPAPLGGWTLDGPTSAPAGARASADHGGGWLSLDGIRYPRLSPEQGVVPSSWQSVRNLWSSTALATAAAASAEGPQVLKADNGAVVEQHAKKAPPPNNCSGHGICVMGQCSCVPGGSSRSVRLGSGDGATDARELSLATGERAWLGDAGRPTLHRVSLGDEVGAELVVAGSAHGMHQATVVVDPGSGSSTWLEEGREPLVLDQADTVQFWQPEVDDEVLSGLWVGDDPERTTAAHQGARPRLIGVVGPEGSSPPLRLPEEVGGEGTTRPELVSGSAEHGAVVVFRRTDGQAFVGVIDVDAALVAEDGLLPFSAGPMPVGGANPDLFDMLALHDGRPLAVGFHAGPPAQALLDDTPEARDLRYPVRTASAEPLPTGPVVMLTVDLAGGEGPQPAPDAVCTLANVTLPVDAIGSADWAERAWVERASQPDCSDLAQPLAAGTFFSDGRQGVFRVDGTGTGTVTALLDDEEASTLAAENPLFESGEGAGTNVLAEMAAGSGDTDGDGIDEVWVTAWGDPGVLLLGGDEGGFGVLGEPGELDHAAGLTETGQTALRRVLLEKPRAETQTRVGDLRY